MARYDEIDTTAGSSPYTREYMTVDLETGSEDGPVRRRRHSRPKRRPYGSVRFNTIGVLVCTGLTIWITYSMCSKVANGGGLHEDVSLLWAAPGAKWAMAGAVASLGCYWLQYLAQLARLRVDSVEFPYLGFISFTFSNLAMIGSGLGSILYNMAIKESCTAGADTVTDDPVTTALCHNSVGLSRAALAQFGIIVFAFIVQFISFLREGTDERAIRCGGLGCCDSTSLCLFQLNADSYGQCCDSVGSCFCGGDCCSGDCCGSCTCGGCNCIC